MVASWIKLARHITATSITKNSLFSSSALHILVTAGDLSKSHTEHTNWSAKLRSHACSDLVNFCLDPNMSIVLEEKDDSFTNRPHAVVNLGALVSHYAITRTIKHSI